MQQVVNRQVHHPRRQAQEHDHLVGHLQLRRPLFHRQRLHRQRLLPFRQQVAGHQATLLLEHLQFRQADLRSQADRLLFQLYLLRHRPYPRMQLAADRPVRQLRPQPQLVRHLCRLTLRRLAHLQVNPQCRLAQALLQFLHRGVHLQHFHHLLRSVRRQARRHLDRQAAQQACHLWQQQVLPQA